MSPRTGPARPGQRQHGAGIRRQQLPAEIAARLGKADFAMGMKAGPDPKPHSAAVGIDKDVGPA